MAQNYGYEFLMTELPTYMKQVLRFSITEVCDRKNINQKPQSLMYKFISLLERCVKLRPIFRNVDLIYITFNGS